MMKIVLLVLALAGILFACRHEFDEPVINQALTVDDAQVWYEANKPGNLMLKSGKEGITEKAVKPNWENATKYESENMEIVETSLMTQGGLGFFTVESKAEWEVSKNPGYISSTTKLVIQKNKKTSESLGFIMTLVGEKNCQEKKGFDLSKSRYLKIEDDFSGLVLFHDLEGNFVNGWRYTEGKVTRSVSALSFENALQLKLKVAITNCITYDVYYWEQNCTDWWSVTYVDGAEVSRTYSRTTCGSQYMVYGGSYTECPATGNGSGTYGGGVNIGGQSSSNVSPRSYSVNTGDKFAKTNMKQNMPPQVLNSCFISIMQYMNQEFCRSTKDINYYNKDYYERYGQWALLVGVDSQKSYEFLSKHFKIHNALNYIYAIDAGHIIMSDVKTMNSSITHAVAIIGYHPDNTLIYMDPSDGSLKEASASYFNTSFAYEISYCLVLEE